MNHRILDAMSDVKFPENIRGLVGGFNAPTKISQIASFSPRDRGENKEKLKSPLLVFLF